MRNSLYYFSLVLLLASYQTKQNNVIEDLHRTIIFGKIVNNSLPTIQLISDEPLGQMLYSDTIDAEGRFKITFPMWHPHDVYLKYGDELIFLFLDPKDSIYVTADADAFSNSLSITGSAKEASECLQLFLPKLFASFNVGSIYDQMQKQSPSEFKAFIAAFQIQGNNVIYKVVQECNANPKAIAWMNDYLNYRCAEFLYKYAEHHTLIENREADYFSFIDDYSAEQPTTTALACSQYYGDAIREHQQFLTRTDSSYQKLIFYAQQGEYKTFLNQFIAKIDNNTVSVAQEIMLSKAFNFVLEKDYQIVEELLERYNEVVTTPILEQQMSYFLEEARNQDSKIITVEQLANNTELADIFTEIGQEHSGKVLYMDLWATWCKPCIQQFPYSARLHDQLAERKVEFIYLCLGSNQDQWQSLIEKYSLKGSHYYLNEAEQNAITSEFGISGVPRYIVFDQQGIIVDKNADQPSSIEILDKLLILTND